MYGPRNQQQGNIRSDGWRPTGVTKRVNRDCTASWGLPAKRGEEGRRGTQVALKLVQRQLRRAERQAGHASVDGVKCKDPRPGAGEGRQGPGVREPGAGAPTEAAAGSEAATVLKRSPPAATEVWGLLLQIREHSSCAGETR